MAQTAPLPRRIAYAAGLDQTSGALVASQARRIRDLMFNGAPIDPKVVADSQKARLKLSRAPGEAAATIAQMAIENGSPNRNHQRRAPRTGVAHEPALERIARDLEAGGADGDGNPQHLEAARPLTSPLPASRGEGYG